MAKAGRKPFSDSAKTVARKRVERGLSQTELARLVGCDMRTIHRWETGDGEPRVSIVRAVAKEFGCTMEELLDD